MNISEAFLSRLESDRAEYVEPWMLSWSYQDRKSSSYNGDLPQNFHDFRGPQDLLSWMLWSSEERRPSYLRRDVESSLARDSVAADLRLLEELTLDPPARDRLDIIGKANAQDFLLSQPYDVPERYHVKRLVDFGAGFGRQSNLWYQQRPDLIYVGVDAIPLSYCLQHLYCSKMTPVLIDYVVDPETFFISEKASRAYHLPTWRMDLVPSNFVDLVICVQVLPELGRRLLRYVLSEFHRILKPGGAIYLRDHDRRWRPGHGIDTNTLLRQTGFELEYRAHIIDGEDLWGIPRIWRKADPRVIASRTRTSEARLRDWKMVVDGLTGGRLGRAYRRLFKT